MALHVSYQVWVLSCHLVLVDIVSSVKTLNYGKSERGFAFLLDIVLVDVDFACILIQVS